MATRQHPPTVVWCFLCVFRALYTYEDETNDLTLSSSGGGGLPEITLTFDNGRVMYGFCSLKDPTAALPRYILINWLRVVVLQREEELRKEEERKKVAEERQRFEEERMELERKEQENREKRYRERERQIEEHRKKMQEEEEARERLRNQITIATEPSIEDLNLDKKESEVEEAKAIIAQRSGNPRDFFKQKERAMTISVDTSPVSVHRAGDDDDEASTERNMAAVSPIPKIVTTPIKEDDRRDEWDSVPKQEQKPPVQESTTTKPVQSVAPQARDSASFNVWESGNDSLVDLWDSSSGPPPSQTSQSSNLVDLMGDMPPSAAAAATAATAGRPQPLLSFDEMMDGTFCSGTSAEDDPSSLVDVTGSDQMTLSYQHALQHASGEGAELDDGQLLMTNGETLLKEGTQASEGYFSQSQEEEFGQSEESSAKPAPVFYNKPPEIDITCWDTDPVVDDDDD
ncbi:drebrin-like [Stegastes partitus]|uniref:Drebrin-like n=2 Tax=Stegastes partitus TaxID=144197 RepID=A0A9Y4NUZ0_9TELE|nr:PREDICTED: drebrin-like [Stegastes partitus]